MSANSTYLDFSTWPTYGKQVAVVFEVNLEGWSNGLGPTAPMPSLASGTYDSYGASYGEYGPRCGMSRLLRLFDDLDVHSTVLVSGIIAEQWPDLVGQIVEKGHEVAGHGYAQNLLSCYLSREDEIEHIERTTAAIESASGVRPIGWRSPRSTSSSETEKLLAEREFLWHGNTDRADLPIIEHWEDHDIVALQRPVWINDLLICDGGKVAARQFVFAFEDALEYCNRAQTESAMLISVAVHAHYFGRPYGAWALEKVVNAAKDCPNVWIAKDSDIANVALKVFSETA